MGEKAGGKAPVIRNRKARHEFEILEELEAGLGSLDAYRKFADGVKETKRKLLTFLIEAREQGKSVVGFLDWVARETGLRVSFSSPEVEKFAGETALHGSMGKLDPA